MGQKVTMQVRIAPKQIAPLTAIATSNIRSVTAEVQAAIARHIEANAVFLRSGPKLKGKAK